MKRLTTEDYALALAVLAFVLFGLMHWALS